MTSTNPVSHIKISQAGLLALLTIVIGQVVAFVPSLASKEQILISAGSTVIAAVFLVANAVHAFAGSKQSPALLGEPLAPVLSTGVTQPPVTVNVHPAPAAPEPVAATTVAGGPPTV